ncbi:6283_t:CDS:1 [Scutellospora calospora]|uniref:6283_t:CDS:1 n=1 Tax=Scutellospora calospora TaxID=85575 RepID=A0ACA9K7N1_9GLOM|nr:6283_t:CDS:1 [Scutellospora calospora]
MTLTPTARFHISLVNQHWYKNILQKTNISNNEFVSIALEMLRSTSKLYSLLLQFLSSSESYIKHIENVANNAVSRQSHDDITKAISKKCKFGELWGLGRKIIIDAIEDENKENYYELLEVFSTILNRSSRRIVSESDDISDNISDGVDDNNNIMNIRNPIKRRPKGRPKSTRITSSLKQSSTKT